MEAQARVEERFAERLDAVRARRGEMKELLADVRAADERFQQLSAAYEEMPKEARRTVYTKVKRLRGVLIVV